MMRRIDRHHVIWLFALTACTGADSSDRREWQARREQVGDTLVVRTLGDGGWVGQDPAPPWPGDVGRNDFQR